MRARLHLRHTIPTRPKREFELLSPLQFETYSHIYWSHTLKTFAIHTALALQNACAAHAGSMAKPAFKLTAAKPTQAVAACAYEMRVWSQRACAIQLISYKANNRVAAAMLFCGSARCRSATHHGRRHNQDPADPYSAAGNRNWVCRVTTQMRTITLP